MPVDLREVLARAVPEPDDPDTTTILRRAGQLRRRSAALRTCAALAVLAVGAGLYGVADGPDAERVVAGPTDDTTLPLPSPGDARPERLVDGTPVFVVRHNDDTTSVLSAVSSHRPFGLGHVVGWCPSSRGFEDPMHGSSYDERGHKRGGPAPTDLDAYEAEPVEGDPTRVRVGALRRATTRSQGAPPPGPSCDGSVEPGNYALQGLVLPPLAGGPTTTPADALAGPPAGVVLVHDAVVVAQRGGPVRACARTEGSDPLQLREADPSTCEGPEVRGVDPAVLDAGRFAGTGGIVLHGRFLARFAAGALTDLTFVRGWETGPAERVEPTDEPFPPRTGVLDKAGVLRGYVDGGVLNSLEPRPFPEPGLPVHTARGELVGYIVEGYGGFVDLETASDPALLRALRENPLQVVDHTGALVGIDEWTRRSRAGIAESR